MAVDYGRIARDIAFTLEVKSAKIFENIFLNHGVLALMGSKGRVKIQKGGNRFDERVHLGQNPNVDHRDKYAEINTTYSDTWRTAQYGISVLDGAAPVNFVDIDENAGASKISALAEAVNEELMNTFANKVADALMATTSGAADPLSIVEEMPATAYGSQTRTTGGIARSDFPGTDRTSAWQTQYNSADVDLSGAAGIGAATEFVWDSCGEGSAINMQPDICVTTAGVLAKASAAADILRRYTASEAMLKLGFDNIKIVNCALIADRNTAAKAGYFMNTNFMRVQVLAGPNTKSSASVKVLGDGKVDVPLQVRPPVEASNKLEFIIKAYLAYNLTFGALKYHGLMDSLTEA